MTQGRLRELIATHGVRKIAESMAHPGRCGGREYVNGKPMYPHDKRAQELATRLMEVLQTQSEYKYLATTGPGEPYTYKPIYRVLALMLEPGGLYPTASKEAAAKVLRLVDPWFVKVLDEDYAAFEYTYDNIWRSYHDW